VKDIVTRDWYIWETYMVLGVRIDRAIPRVSGVTGHDNSVNILVNVGLWILEDICAGVGR